MDVRRNGGEKEERKEVGCQDVPHPCHDASPIQAIPLQVPHSSSGPGTVTWKVLTRRKNLSERYGSSVSSTRIWTSATCKSAANWTSPTYRLYLQFHHSICLKPHPPLPYCPQVHPSAPLASRDPDPSLVPLRVCLPLFSACLSIIPVNASLSSVPPSVTRCYGLISHSVSSAFIYL